MSSALIAQKTFKTSQQAVQRTVKKMFDALSYRDSVNLKAHSAADITLHEYGRVWNVDTIILEAITLNQSADLKHTISFAFINTKVDKSTAWITYRLQSVITKNGKTANVQWLETVALVKAKK